jgi:hypothetical protein
MICGIPGAIYCERRYGGAERKQRNVHGGKDTRCLGGKLGHILGSWFIRFTSWFFIYIWSRSFT